MLFRDNPDKASNNTVNGGGDRSIQRVKLVQQVKERLNELNGGLISIWGGQSTEG